MKQLGIALALLFFGKLVRYKYFNMSTVKLAAAPVPGSGY
jgi:hypothetical protein